VEPLLTGTVSVGAADEGTEPPPRSPLPPATPEPASAPPAVTPLPPRELAAVATGPSSIDVTWSASGLGPWSYEVLRGEEIAATSERTGFRDAGLRPGTRHCYKIRALATGGARSVAVGPVCASTPDVTAPSAPSDLTASAPTSGSLLLRWEASRDDGIVAGYEVMRGSELVATTALPTFAESGLAPYSEHCYVVRSFDSAGNRSDSTAPACARTTDTSAPTAPGSASAAATGERTVALRWTAASDDVGIAKYEVWFGERLVATTREERIEERDLRPGHEYCYTVVAFDPAGNRSPHSSRACVSTPDKSPPSVPGDFAAAAISPREIALSWKPSQDDGAVTAYEVLRRGEVLATIQSPGFTERGLAPWSEHCNPARDDHPGGNPPAAPAPPGPPTPHTLPPTPPPR
jgi:hypothetical protein